MTYQITISKQGNLFQTMTVQAPNALAAIKRVEQGFKTRRYQFGENGTTQIVEWTGLEFQARQIN